MKKAQKDEAQEGRFAYEGLDRALHEKARLGIMTSLAGKPNGMLFGELKELCALTDGNLSRHLDVLKDAGLIEIWKGFEGRRPQTLVRLTKSGRQRFIEYLAELEKVIRDAMPAAKANPVKEIKPEKLGPGWVPA
jgi:DNA-binding transcriptional ArsR family regulator